MRRVLAVRGPRLAVVVVSTLVLVACPGADAWDGHDMITSTAVASLDWLDRLPPITVTSPSDAIPGINPTYRFAFHGEAAGQTMTARQILVRYASEPDWGMDQDIHASWQQRFMGGSTGPSSQAYFHMYYPPFTVHVPIPGIAMGAAPDRLVTWYESARRAFAREDPYWGFRFLACALHYIQDVAQPYHATQTALAFVHLRHPIEGTTKITGNYHFVYEGWVRRQMEREATAARGEGFGLLAAVGGAREVRFDALRHYVTRVASTSHRHSGQLLRASLDFFDRRFRQPRDVPATDRDLDQLEPTGPRTRMVASTLPALELSGASIRGFLGFSRQDLLATAARRWLERSGRFERLHSYRSGTQARRP